MNSILKLTAILILPLMLSACFTIGKVGYLEPTAGEGPGVENGDIVGRNCQGTFFDIVTNTFRNATARSKTEAWENVAITYKPEGLEGCVYLYKSAGGTK